MSKHPPLKELNEYACGSLDETRRKELAGHINVCPKCTEEVEESRMLDSAVRAELTMMDGKGAVGVCLPPSMLADYFDGLLATEQLAAAEQHLSECPSCRENLIEMRAILTKQHKGELVNFDEMTSARARNLIASELGTGDDVEQASLICMACSQPIPTDSRFCSLCGAAIAPPKRNLSFLFARRQGVSELIRAHIWLALSLSAMAASFFLDRYFTQFIAIALIFGAKWILDQAQFRIYRDMLKSLKTNVEPEKESKSRKRKAL
jgi:hypothetical protein